MKKRIKDATKKIARKYALMKILARIYLVVFVLFGVKRIVTGSLIEGVVIIAVTIFVFTYLMRNITEDEKLERAGLAKRDERSRLLSLKSDSMAFWMSYVLVSALLIYDEFGRTISATSALSITLVGMALLTIITNEYYKGKGI